MFANNRICPYAFCLPLLSQKKLCMASKILQITLEMNLNVFARDSPRPYHPFFFFYNPSDDCLSVHVVPIHMVLMLPGFTSLGRQTGSTVH